jgi:hypothetical protein
MNRALVLLGLALMDLCWIYPWSLLLALWLAGDTTLLSPMTLFALLSLATASSMLLLPRLRGRRRSQLTLIGLGVIVSLIAVRIDHFSAAGALDWLPRTAEAVAGLIGQPTAPAVALLLAVMAWRRGVQLGTDVPAFPDVENAFRWNIGALVVFALVLAVAVRPSQQPLLEARATPFVVGSFFVGLLTMAIARLESLRTRTNALALNTQWLGVLIAVAGLLILASLAVAQLLSFDLLLSASRPLFDLLGRLVLLLLYVIIVPLAYVIELIVYWLMQFFNLGGEGQPPEPMQASDLEGFLERLFNQLLSPDAIAALKVLGALVLVAIALLLIGRAVARWRPRVSESDTALEERDSVWQAGTFREALWAWLRSLLRRRTAAVTDPAAAGTLSAPDASNALVTVRELYRRLLTMGDEAGKRRPAASTPYEHLPALTGALEPRPELEQVTEAYVVARYAEIEAPQLEVEVLREQLERVRASDPGA